MFREHRADCLLGALLIRPGLAFGDTLSVTVKSCQTAPQGVLPGTMTGRGTDRYSPAERISSGIHPGQAGEPNRYPLRYRATTRNEGVSNT